MIRTIVSVTVFVLILLWIANNPAAADQFAHNIASFLVGLTK